MSFDRKYLVWGLGYLVFGMGLGIFMAASHNHAQQSTHTHILLLGFVVSFAYAVIHKLWLGKMPPRLAIIQFIVHQAGSVVMFIGLFLLFGNIASDAQLSPVLAMSSIAVFFAAVLMMFMVLKANTVKT